MQITSGPQALPDLTPADAAHFTGKAGLRTLLPAAGPLPPTSVALVRFEPGVRNHWHSHAGGQLIFGIEGEGWVQARRAGARRIGVGDSVVTEPNEEHWHGAGQGAPLAHLVVNIGQTRWLEESPPPPDYAALSSAPRALLAW
jgi:quercetin dioxygenase-like cupin family protein